MTIQIDPGTVAIAIGLVACAILLVGGIAIGYVRDMTASAILWAFLFIIFALIALVLLVIAKMND